MAAEVSHGRGGAGNINPDETRYVDGDEAARQQEQQQQVDGQEVIRAGRGGAGNIVDKEDHRARASIDVGAAAAMPVDGKSSGTEEAYHTGRGGAGNEQHPGGGDGGNEEEAKKGGGLVGRLKKKLRAAMK